MKTITQHINFYIPSFSPRPPLGEFMKISLPWPGLFIKEGDSEKQKRKVIVARTIAFVIALPIAIYITSLPTVFFLLCAYIAYRELRYDEIVYFLKQTNKTLWPADFTYVVLATIYALGLACLVICSICALFIPFEQTHNTFLLTLPLYWVVGIKWIGIRLIYNNVKQWIDSAPDA